MPCGNLYISPQHTSKFSFFDSVALCYSSLIPSPSHSSFSLAAVEKKRFFSTAARLKLEWEGLETRLELQCMVPLIWHYRNT